MLYFKSISDASSDIGSYTLTGKAIQIYFQRFIQLMPEMVSNDKFY